MFKPITQFMLVYVWCFFLFGCSSLTMNAVTYHDKPFVVSKKTYAYFPVPNTGQAVSPQYKYYTQLIDGYMKGKGMKRVPVTKADYGIVIVYRVGHPEKHTDYEPNYGQIGEQVVSSDSSVDYTSFGSSASARSNTTYQTAPVYGVTGYTPEEYKTFPYMFNFYVFKKTDVKFMRSHNKLRAPVYSTKLTSVTDSYNPDQVFPQMIEGLFVDIFPGENGQVTTFSV